MEIRLKAAHSNAGTGAIVDEYGALWKCSGPKPAHGIFVATTTGLDGEVIHGYYQNGSLFIVDTSNARSYFSSVNSRRGSEI